MSIARKLVSREVFMGLFLASVGGIASVLIGVPIIGVIISPLVNQPSDVWRDVGAVSDFPVGETIQRNFQYPTTAISQWSGPTKLTAAWVRRDSAVRFTAFAVYCTHLGCPVHWLQTPKIFLCPCHGSVFNADGTVAGGPAPRPLFRYDTRVRNGRLQIKTEAQPVVT